MTNLVQSNLLVITSLHGGAGDKTDKLTTIGGVGSARLHLQPMFNAARELDLGPRLLSLDIDDPSILNELGNPKLCVIGKINHFDDSRLAGFAIATLAAVARLKARNVKIALMYCDHLAPLHCARGSLYRDLLLLSDFIIVPCQAMADRARDFLSISKPISIIVDPWQVPLSDYKTFDGKQPLRLGWFGNANNVYFLCEQIGHLMNTINAVSAIELVVLSNKVALNMVETVFHKCLPVAAKPWTLDLVEWDDSRQPNQLADLLESVHVVCLPSNPSSPIKGGVSHNRLVDAIRSGSIVVASSMQSYRELSQLALLGENPALLINQLIPQYERLIAKYDSLRLDLLERFSPDLNKIHWRHLLIEMLNTHK